MPKKRPSPEQIVTLLWQIEVATSSGKSVTIACREAEISDQSYYRWRKEYGGLDLDQARRMKDLAKENKHRAILAAAYDLPVVSSGECLDWVLLTQEAAMSERPSPITKADIAAAINGQARGVIVGCDFASPTYKE